MAEITSYPNEEPETSIVFNAFQHLDEFNALISECCISINDSRKEESLLNKFTSLFHFNINTTIYPSTFWILSRTATSAGSISPRNSGEMYFDN